MPEKEYQRLTLARSRSALSIAFMSRSSLWLGRDHLLCVDSSGYTETYKRFYFRDIQAITLYRTKRYQWWNVIVGLFVLAFLIFIVAGAPKIPPAQWTSGDVAGLSFLAGITGLLVLLLLINFFFGPTCKTFLRTAVQVEELPSLNRVRRAHKVLARIRPLIVVVQGELAPDEIASRMRTIVGSPAGTTIAPDISGTTPPPASPEAPPVIS